MVKTVIKETLIILLLCVAILLILGVLFYDYNPMNKVVPNKIAYKVPENIKDELKEESLKSAISIENKIYTVDGSDLNIYKKNKAYNPSKENPFANTITSGTTSGTTSTASVVDPSGNNNSGNNNSSTTTQTTSGSSTSTQKKGLK